MRFGRRGTDATSAEESSQENAGAKASGRVKRIGALLLIAIVWLGVNYFAPAPDNQAGTGAPAYTPIALPTATPLTLPTKGH